LQVPILPSPHTEAAYGTALLAQHSLTWAWAKKNCHRD
jgi:hypothetical protein